MQAGRPYGWWLWGLRTAALGLLGTLLLNFQRERAVAVHPQPLLVVVVDHSASMMAVRDSLYYRDTFFVRLRRLLAEQAGRWRMDTLLVGERVRRGLPRTFDDGVSRLGEFLHYVREGYAGRPLHGVVFITDGIANAGPSPEGLARAGLPPIFTIRMGDTTPRTDVRIAAVEYNRTVKAGHPTPLRVFIDAPPHMEGSGTLFVEVDGRRREAITRPWAQLTAEPVELMLPGFDSGFHRLTVRLVPPPGDANPRNNVRRLIVKASVFRHRALIAALGPHPDVGLLQRRVAALDGWEVEVLSAARLRGRSWPDPHRYDVLILYELPAAGIPVPGLGPFLSAFRGGVWMVFGKRTDAAYVQRQWGVGLQRVAPRPVRIQRVNYGFPYFSLPDGAGAAVGRELLSWYVLSSGDWEPLLEGKAGAVVAGGYRNGRPYVLWNGQNFWKWGFEGSADPTPELVPRLMEFLAAPRSHAFRLVGASEEYPAGRSIRWRFEVTNASGRPDARASVWFTIRRQDTSAGTEWTAAWDGRYYRAETPAPPPGLYVLEAEARLGDHRMQLRHGFAVLDNSFEYQDLRARHGWLRELSERTGGVSYEPRAWDSVAALLHRLAETPLPPAHVRRNAPLLDEFVWGAVILGLLFIEWFLRRWAGYY